MLKSAQLVLRTRSLQSAEESSGGRRAETSWPGEEAGPRPSLTSSGRRKSLLGWLSDDDPGGRYGGFLEVAVDPADGESDIGGVRRAIGDAVDSDSETVTWSSLCDSDLDTGSDNNLSTAEEFDHRQLEVAGGGRIAGAGSWWAAQVVGGKQHHYLAYLAPASPPDPTAVADTGRENVEEDG
jgi:hypothetical protein